MKIRIAVDPDAAHEATLIERDRITGRDINVFTAEPGEAFEFDISADTFIFAQQGRRVSDDGDGGGGGGPAVGSGRKLELEDLLGAMGGDDDEFADDEAAAATAADAAAAAATDAPAPSGADSQAGTEPPLEQKLEPTDASDTEIRVIMAALASEPSVERTQSGAIHVNTINKALEARNYKPITAAKRDELAAPPAA